MTKTLPKQIGIRTAETAVSRRREAEIRIAENRPQTATPSGPTAVLGTIVDCHLDTRYSVTNPTPVMVVRDVRGFLVEARVPAAMVRKFTVSSAAIHVVGDLIGQAYLMLGARVSFTADIHPTDFRPVAKRVSKAVLHTRIVQMPIVDVTAGRANCRRRDDGLGQIY